jgi:hypothetical protein
MGLLRTLDGAVGPYGSPVLDGFGTADSTPIIAGWSAGIGSSPPGGDGIITVAGTATRPAAGSYRHADHYSKGGTFGGGTQACEVWAELAGVASSQEFQLTAMLTSPGSGSGNDYSLYVDWSSGGGSPTVSANRRNLTVHSNIIASFSQSLAAGDALALVVIPSGANVTLEIWHRTVSGSWSKIANATDTSPLTTAGYLGVGFAGGQGFKARVFGGGNVTAGSALTQDINDSVTMSDAVALEQGKGVVDTLSLADALTFERAITLADTLGLTDALAFERAISLVDSLGISDNIAAERGLALAVGDSLGLADSLTPETGKGVSIDDTVSLADALRFDRGLVIADNVSLSDALAKTFHMNIADAVSLADAIDAASEYQVVIIDSLAVSDFVVTELGGVEPPSDTNRRLIYIRQGFYRRRGRSIEP